jgi:hypothetical protein
MNRVSLRLFKAMKFVYFVLCHLGWGRVWTWVYDPPMTFTILSGRLVGDTGCPAKTSAKGGHPRWVSNWRFLSVEEHWTRRSTLYPKIIKYCQLVAAFFRRFLATAASSPLSKVGLLGHPTDVCDFSADLKAWKPAHVERFCHELSTDP